MLKHRRNPRVEDFDLQIWRVSEKRFRAWVRDPGGRGEAHWEFDDPFLSDPGIQEALREMVGGCRDLKPSRAPSKDAALDVGSRLFKAVFGGDVLAFWNQRLLEAQRTGKALRLRLHLDPPKTWGWPWELLCNAKRDFLAVNPETPVVRYIEMADLIKPLRVRLPLRVLAVTSSPSGLSPLGVDDELKDLEKSLESLMEANWVELETLRGATRETLLRTLQEKDFHVLHFIGHGAFDSGRQQGMICLEGQNRSPDPLDGLDLSALLRFQPRLRLVVLNACNGARGVEADPFASLVQNLVKTRIPAVIAMQSAVTDRAAITFARHFYESLSRREPVDRAVTEARQAMLFLGSGEWGSPILAMRVPDGRIIVPPWWELLHNSVLQFVSTWRYWLLALLLLVFLFVGLRPLARRWIDPNRLFAYFNPPECPSPKGLPIAFVKVEPGRGHPFCMSRFEVTQRLVRKVLGKVRTRRRGDALPAVRVSWHETAAFFAALEKRDPGGRFRLTSQAEWDAVTGMGMSLKATSETANCENKEANDGYEGLAPVGSFPPNAFGIYDMAGNVAEWGSEADGEKRIVRGGSFENALRNCWARYWTSLSPDRKDDVGFRIIRDPVPIPSK